MEFLLLAKTIAVAYFLGVNVYGFILINFQRKQPPKKKPVACDISTQSLKTDDNISQTENSAKEKPPEIKPINNANVKKISNVKLFITGVLGGALGIYTAMFVYKHKLNSFFLMVIMPIFIAVSLFFLVSAISSGFWMPNVNAG